MVLRPLWLLVLKWPNYLNCLRSATKVWERECICEKEGKVPSLYSLFRREQFVCIPVNSKPLPRKSKPKEVQGVKLYGMCYPWLSCGKFNSIVQKAAVQNCESIWFQFNQLEVPRWPILRLRDIASQCMTHIFLFGRKPFGFLLPNSVSKDVWEPQEGGS